MNSIGFIENLAKKSLSSTIHKETYINIYAWNRTKDDKSDPDLIWTASRNTYPVEEKQSRSNQRIGSIPISAVNWDFLVKQARTVSGKQEAGIGALVESDTGNSLYLPFIDFNTQLKQQDRFTYAFWKDITAKYPRKKLYLFNTGSSYHGVLDCLMDIHEIYNWFTFLIFHQEVVDQKWVKFAETYDHMGVLRTTSGLTRPEPKLWKWVNL